MLPGQHPPSLGNCSHSRSNHRRPGFSGLEKQSLSAPPRETSCLWECAPHRERRDSEGAGSTPPGDGAAPLVAAASEARACGSTHALHLLSSKERGHVSSLELLRKMSQQGTRQASRTSSRWTAQSCATQTLIPSPMWLLTFNVMKMKHNERASASVHWPHSSCPEATSGRWLPYWTVQRKTVLITAESSTGQCCPQVLGTPTPSPCPRGPATRSRPLAIRSQHSGARA